MYSTKRTKAIEGNFTLLALNENKKPTKVLSNE
jgi:acyl-CoA hydrolase